MSTTTKQDSSKAPEAPKATETNGPRKVTAIERELRAIQSLREDDTLPRAQKTVLTKKIKDLQHELTEAQTREGVTPTAAPAPAAAAASQTAKPKKERKPKTYTVKGFVPTPISASGSRFDNEAIAKASETAKDLWELEAALAKSHGYSLDDGGAFRRRLANMVRNGQINTKFTPTGQKRPSAEQVVAAVAAKGDKPASTRGTRKPAAKPAAAANKASASRTTKAKAAPKAA